MGFNNYHVADISQRVGKVSTGFLVAAGSCAATAGVGCVVALGYGIDHSSSGALGNPSFFDSGVTRLGGDPEFWNMVAQAGFGGLAMAEMVIASKLPAAASASNMLTGTAKGGAKAAKGGAGIRSRVRAPGTPRQVRSSGAVHKIIDDGKTLVVSENHFAKDIGKLFSRYNGGARNIFRSAFWKHVLPHRHVYRLPSAPASLNANWRKTFSRLGAEKTTVWPWQ